MTWVPLIILNPFYMPKSFICLLTDFPNRAIEFNEVMQRLLGVMSWKIFWVGKATISSIYLHWRQPTSKHNANQFKVPQSHLLYIGLWSVMPIHHALFIESTRPFPPGWVLGRLYSSTQNMYVRVYRGDLKQSQGGWGAVGVGCWLLKIFSWRNQQDLWHNGNYQEKNGNTLQ